MSGFRAMEAGVYQAFAFSLPHGRFVGRSIGSLNKIPQPDSLERQHLYTGLNNYLYSFGDSLSQV